MRPSSACCWHRSPPGLSASASAGFSSRAERQTEAQRERRVDRGPAPFVLLAVGAGGAIPGPLQPSFERHGDMAELAAAIDAQQDRGPLALAHFLHPLGDLGRAL